MKIGYARVSTEEQSPDLQIDALKKAASLFESSFGIDAFGGIEDKESFSAKRVKFSNAYGNLGSTFGDSRNMVQQLLNLGQHDLIRELGLINEKLFVFLFFHLLSLVNSYRKNSE